METDTKENRSLAKIPLAERSPDNRRYALDVISFCSLHHIKSETWSVSKEGIVTPASSIEYQAVRGAAITVLVNKLRKIWKMESNLENNFIEHGFKVANGFNQRNQECRVIYHHFLAHEVIEALAIQLRDEIDKAHVATRTPFEPNIKMLATFFSRVQGARTATIESKRIIGEYQLETSEPPYSRAPSLRSEPIRVRVPLTESEPRPWRVPNGRSESK